MSTKNLNYCLLPIYLINPSCNSAFRYAAWDINGKVCHLELKPLQPLLYRLRNTIEYILNSIVNGSTANQSSWIFSMIQPLQSSLMYCRSSPFEILILLQGLEMFMYMFNHQVQQRYCEQLSRDASDTNQPPLNRIVKDIVKHIPKLYTSALMKKKVSNVSVTSSKEKDLIFKNFPLTPQSVTDFLQRCLSKAYKLGSLIEIPDCRALNLYFNKQPELTQSKPYQHLVLQPPNQHLSFLVDLLHLNILCFNLDETQVLNLLTTSIQLDPFVLFNDVVNAVERQIDQFAKLIQSNQGTSTNQPDAIQPFPAQTTEMQRQLVHSQLQQERQEIQRESYPQASQASHGSNFSTNLPEKHQVNFVGSSTICRHTFPAEMSFLIRRDILTANENRLSFINLIALMKQQE